MLFLVIAAFPRGAAGEAGYYYAGEWVPLEADPGWIAVYGGAEKSLTEVLEFILGADLIVDARYGHPFPGWFLYHLPNQGTQAHLIEKLVAADDEDGRRDYYFAPVFAGRSGGATMPSKGILLKWAGEPAWNLLDGSPPEGCFGDPEPVPLPSMPSVYRLRPQCHSGLRLLEYANRLAESNEVAFSEPDMIVGGTREPRALPGPVGKSTGFPKAREKLTPNDEFFGESWHWQNTGQEGGTTGMDVNITKAWDLTTGEAGIETVIIDVGVEQDHPDINQQPGQDFTGQSSTGGGPFNKCDIHGTPVAGAVSAPINNAGTVGAAPATISRSARTFISEVDDPCSGRWSTQFSWTVDALDWALSEGIRVSNNSNSYDQPSSTIASKYQETHDAGMVHFASAGNDASQGVNFPASLSTVNAVSAIDRFGQLAEFSNFGDGVSLAAPGVEIQLPDRQGGFGYNDSGAFFIGDGTSYASPIAAGVAALLLSRARNLDGTEVELFLQAAARDLGAAGKDDEYGWGLVNALDTLLLLDIFEDDLETGDSDRWSKTVP